MHYPEDWKYTIKPLEVTHLAGRDPVTGRVVSIYYVIQSVYKWNLRCNQLIELICLENRFRLQKVLVAV